ncbi:MAG: cobalamin-dependent protein, partial [Deltaproteobacteria bacterium]|nr:cobalamin-dependent protein [Deltaproteobacteria bacterium]
MRALIVHVPMGFSRDDWSHNYINIMPMGVLSVANHANRNGHHVKVMNTAVLGSRDEALESVLERIEKERFEVVGFTLHWHLAAYDVMFAVEQVKARAPAVATVIGGSTASIHARELMALGASLDAVIQGDGEIPFARYLDEMSRGEEQRDLALVPNLHWRDPGSGHVAFTGLTHVANREQADSFDFGPAALYGTRDYANGSSMFEAIRGDRTKTVEETIEDKWFFLNVGRGCNLNCIYCAGSRLAQERYFGRSEVVIRSVDAVVKTVRSAHEAGFVS